MHDIDKLNPVTKKHPWEGMPGGEARKARADLMRAINDYLDRYEVATEDVMSRTGLGQSHVSELRNGKLSRFSMEKLVEIASALGIALNINMTVTTTMEFSHAPIHVHGPFEEIA